MEPFKPVVITGLNESKTKKDPRAGSSLFEVCLDLSPKPSFDWCQEFDRAWKEHIYGDKRGASAGLGSITITCSLDDWDSVHLPHLNKVIDGVNLRQKAAHEAQHARLERMKQEDAAAKLKIAEAANRFKKDS